MLGGDIVSQAAAILANPVSTKEHVWHTTSIAEAVELKREVADKVGDFFKTGYEDICTSIMREL